MRSEIRRSLDAASSAKWGMLLWLGGRARPECIAPPSGGERVMIIAPHPDDELAGCGGTLLRHRAAGDEIMVVHVTDGRRSRAVPGDPAERGARRKAEAAAAIRLLGVTRWEWLGLPESEWGESGLERGLTQLLDEWRPTLVYAPSRVDFHPEHIRVAAVTARCIARRAVRVRVYQVQVPLTFALANVIVPVSEVWDRISELRACYPTQESALRGPLRLRRYDARAAHLPGRIELFWELTARAYAEVHSLPAAPAHVFRGLRRLALTDWLAFTRGSTERTRLRAVARETR